jgi:hypothetical protein
MISHSKRSLASSGILHLLPPVIGFNDVGLDLPATSKGIVDPIFFSYSNVCGDEGQISFLYSFQKGEKHFLHL